MAMARGTADLGFSLAGPTSPSFFPSSHLGFSGLLPGSGVSVLGRPGAGLGGGAGFFTLAASAAGSVRTGDGGGVGTGLTLPPPSFQLGLAGGGVSGAGGKSGTRVGPGLVGVN